jgi:hypothetical protein
MKRFTALVLCMLLCFAAFACRTGSKDGERPGTVDPTDPGTTDPGTTDPDDPTDPDVPTDDLSYRTARTLTDVPAPPSYEVREDTLPAANAAELTADGTTLSMGAGSVRADFRMQEGGYVLEIVSAADPHAVMFTSGTPAHVYIRPQAGGAKDYAAAYASVTQKSYGYLATAVVVTAAGTRVTVEDRYYYAAENEPNTVNVRRAVLISEVKAADRGFSSELAVSTAAVPADLEWFVPNRVYRTNGLSGDGAVWRETQLGLPFAMLRDKTNGFTLSLSRYQPVIHYDNLAYASIGVTLRSAADAAVRPNVEVAYPGRDSSRKYHDIAEGATHVYDMSIRAAVTESYDTATAEVYNAHFALQNQRVTATDIDAVYNTIGADMNAILRTTEYDKNGKRFTEYGLPHVNIKTENFGPLAYRIGFEGQAMPIAYNMMLYGIINDNRESLENGIKTLDFWVDDAKFMLPSGVPQFRYEVTSAAVDKLAAIPTSMRYAVDGLEGLLDAYRLAAAHGILRPTWRAAIDKFADFLVAKQNADGSWYQVYNRSGGMYQSGDDGITNAGLAQKAASKNNTTMPIRFLGKMFELTGDATYKTAALKAGEYVFAHIYPTGVYAGGTADNADIVDREAGVYAMYAYDTLYTLTGGAKWLSALKQATAFAMSAVQAFSFPIRAQSLKAGKVLEYGYNDGMSFIAVGSNGMDNFMAYTYYALFRLYVFTGEKTYLRQAEFIQQNTKSTMDFDGALGYRFKSLVAEATTIYAFGFACADDGLSMPWSLAANAEPIAKMLTAFGDGDVMTYRNTPLAELRATLEAVGVGGKPHKVYQNTIT